MAALADQLDIPPDFAFELSIIVPARDEGDTIVHLLFDLRRHFPGAEIIVVDNASTDDTVVKALSVPRVRVLYEHTPGKGHAMRRGALFASRAFLLFHDADSEYSVEDAREVVSSVVCGQSGNPNRVMGIGVRAWRLSWLPLVSFGVNLVVRTILDWRYRHSPEDVLTGTRCLSRDLFLAMQTQSAGFAIETEISRLVVASGIPVVSLPVRYTPRTRAEGKKINWRHFGPILREAVSRREAPLQNLLSAPPSRAAVAR